eukprot:227669_1
MAAPQQPYQTTTAYQQPQPQMYQVSGDGQPQTVVYQTQPPPQQVVYYAPSQQYQAQPVPQQQQGYPSANRQPHTQPIHPQPHQPRLPRNACLKCGELYPLPSGATSWRCRQCGHFNDLQPTCCTIL